MKNKKSQIAETSLRGLISLIPYIGGAVIEITLEHRNRVKTERITNFVEQLKAYFKDIDKSKVDNEFIQSNRFSDIFEDVINTVSKTDDDKKAERLKQLLSGSIAPNASVNRFENFIDLIRRLNDDQILILERFYRNKSKAEKSKDEITILEKEIVESKKEEVALKEKANQGTIKTHESISDVMKKTIAIEYKSLLAKKEYGQLTQFSRMDFNDLNENEAQYLVEDLISKRLLLNISSIQMGASEETYDEVTISHIGSEFIRYLKSI
jgi:hypothetical protein